MNHSLKINKSIQYAGIIILVLVFVFASVAAIPPVNVEKSVSASAISSYRTAQANPVLSDEEKIKSAIDAYFTTRYEGQKLLQTQDFSTLLADNTQPWVKKEQDKRDIELYVAKLFDLQYLTYKYTLDYSSITIDKDQATVQLSESHDVVFKVMAPEVSSMANLQHVLTLHNKNGSWLIYRDEYRDELSEEMDHVVKADILKQVDINYRNQFTAQSSGPTQSLVNPLLSQYSYNRSSASNYAGTWSCTGCTNPNYSPRQAGGDCADFVSQAIYAGMGYNPPYNQNGMSVQSGGWYYDFYTKTGSPAWVGVPQQYGFITGNTGLKGPYGTGSQTNCSVQWGDVVQIQYPNPGSWTHEGIIVHAGNPCTGLSSKWVDAHDTDRRNYPLSYWSTYVMRYILINGYYGN